MDEDYVKKTFLFECSGCGEETPITAIINLPDHVYDHVLSCDQCSQELIDYVFTRFAEIGIAVRVSGIKSLIKFLDEFMLKKHQELEVEENDEPVQPEDSNDDKSVE